MAIFLLTPEEMWTLATLSGHRRNGLSPLHHLDSGAATFGEPERLKRNADRLVKAGFLWADESGQLHHAFEVHLWQWLLHDPDQVVFLRRLRRLDLGAAYLCRKANVWAAYVLARDGALHQVHFPLNRADLDAWAAHELLAGGPDPAPARTSLDVRLAPRELLLLFCAQNLYGDRVAARRAPLADADQWFDLRALLLDGDLIRVVKSLPPMFPRSLGDAATALTRVEEVMASLGHLAAQGLLDRRPARPGGLEEFRYSPALREWLNPAGLHDLIAVQDPAVPTAASVVYLRREGWLHLTAQGEGLHLRAYDPGAGPGALVTALLGR